MRPSPSDIHGLLHLDQIWFLLHLKYHFQFYFVLVRELLSQAFLNKLTSPLLLKQEDGVFSLPILEWGQTRALRRSSREWDYIVDILSSLFRYFWGHKNSIGTTLESTETSKRQPWCPRLKYSRHRWCDWQLTVPWWAWSKNSADTWARPIHSLALSISEATTCCSRRIYSVRGAAGLLLGDKVSSSGAGIIFQPQASPWCHPQWRTETPSTNLFVSSCHSVCPLLHGHCGSE